MNFNKKLLTALTLTMVLVLSFAGFSFADEGDHLHGDRIYTKWESTTAIPTAAGYYYLDADINMAARAVITSSAADVHICLNGHTITAPADNQIVLLQNGAKIEFCDHTAEFDSETGKLKAAGILTGGHGTYGSLIQAQNTATVTLDGVIVKDNTGVGTAGMGGAILGRGSAKINIKNSIFENNTTQLDGGAIAVKEASTLTVSNTVFKGNSSVKEGGAISMVSGNGQVSIENCEFTGNKGLNGSAVRANSSSVFTMKDCVITGNTDLATGNYSGALYLIGTGCTLEGSCVIEGNLNSAAATSPADLLLQNASTTIELKNPTAQTKLSMKTFALQTGVANKAKGDTLGNLTGDFLGEYTWTTDPSLAILNEEGKLVLGDKPIVYHYHGDEEFTPWEKTNSLPTEPGNYCLMVDVDLAERALVNKKNAEIKLCLNGHTINGGGRTYIYNLASDTTLSLCDCTAVKGEDGRLVSGGVITGGTSKDFAGAILVNNATLNAENVIFSGNSSTLATTGAWGGGVINARQSAKVNLTDCILADNKCTVEGGAMAIRADSVVVLKNTIIKDNYAEKVGGAIYLCTSGKTADGSVLTMDNCLVSGNKTAVDGGAIAIKIGGKLNIIGGEYIGNSVGNLKGGVIYGENAEIDIKDALFEGNMAPQGGTLMTYSSTITIGGKSVFKKNIASEAGGAIIAGGSTQITINDGEFTEHETPNGGAMVIQGKAVLTLNGGNIHDNRTSQSGAGIYISNNSTVIMNGGAIKNNTAENRGGGIYINAGELQMAGGEISGNYAKNTGGGVHEMNGKITVSGGKISDNSTDSFGGGIFCNAGEMKLSGGEISGNSTKVTGGALSLDKKAVLTMTGGEIKKNKASSGAGVMIQNEAGLILEGGKINNNKAEKYAGGVYSGTKGKLTMNGGSISGNSAKLGAGGLFVNNGTADLNGGGIDSNSTGGAGGGMATSGKAVVNLNGTGFDGNSAEQNGGGIYVFTGGKVKYNRVKVTNNVSKKTGGGIFSQTEPITIGKGVTVSGNEATAGGGIGIGNKSILTMNGGKVTKNKAADAGGIVVQSRTGMVLNGGEISHNYVTSQGAGIYVAANATFEMNGGKITENTAVFRGGGLFINSPGTINDGEISYNHVLGGENLNMPSGGGILICGELPKTLTMNGGVIKGNDAANNGGGVRVNYGTTFQFNGGSIIENKAGICGGGIEVFGTVITTGGEIKNNYAGSNGGAMRVCPQCKVIFENTVMDGNSCGKTGGAVHLKSGTNGTFKNCTFTNNTSGLEGGAIWAADELYLDGGIITGNKSEKEGTVYLEEGSTDGHSYVHSVIKIGGDIKITGNEGPNPGVIITPGNVLVVVGQLGENAQFPVYIGQSDIGTKVSGVYDYEFREADGSYLITSGDASLHLYDDQAEPEDPQPVPEEPTTEAQSGEPADEKAPTGGKALLYGAVGVGCAALIGGGVFFIVKKSRKKDGENK